MMSLTPIPSRQALPPLLGLIPDLGRPVHLRTLIATSLWMMILPRKATALAKEPRKVVRTHFRDKEKEVQRGVSVCPRSHSQ